MVLLAVLASKENVETGDPLALLDPVAKRAHQERVVLVDSLDPPEAPAHEVSLVQRENRDTVDLPVLLEVQDPKVNLEIQDPRESKETLVNQESQAEQESGESPVSLDVKAPQETLASRASLESLVVMADQDHRACPAPKETLDHRALQALVESRARWVRTAVQVALAPTEPLASPVCLATRDHVERTASQDLRDQWDLPDPKDNVVTPEPLVLQERPDLQDSWVQEEHVDLKDATARTVILDLQDRLALSDPKDPKESPVQADPLASPVPLDFKAAQVTKVPMVRLDFLETKACPVCKDLQDPLVAPEALEIVAPEARRDPMDPEDQQDLEDLRDLKVLMDPVAKRAILVTVVIRVILAILDSQDWSDLRDPLEKAAQEDLWDHQDQEDPMVAVDLLAQTVKSAQKAPLDVQDHVDPLEKTEDGDPKERLELQDNQAHQASLSSLLPCLHGPRDQSLVTHTWAMHPMPRLRAQLML